MENTNNTSIKVDVSTNLVRIRVSKGRRFIGFLLPTLYLTKQDLLSLFTPTVKSISNICMNAIFSMESTIFEITESIKYINTNNISIMITDSNDIKIRIDTEPMVMAFTLSSELLSYNDIIALLGRDFNSIISVIREYTNSLNKLISEIQCKVDKMNK